MKADELVRKYQELRDFKAAEEAQHKERKARIEQAMEQVEGLLLAQMDALGVDSVKVAGLGTVYKAIRVFASVADWDSTLKWIQDNQAWHVLTRGVKKDEIEQVLVQTGDIVPGVNLRREVTVNVRKA